VVYAGDGFRVKATNLFDLAERLSELAREKGSEYHNSGVNLLSSVVASATTVRVRP
jgi:hypothetical protein